MTRRTTEPCRSCAAPVIWCITTAGRTMPVDADPAPDGNITIEDRGGQQPLARTLTTTQQFGRTNLHKSHFATCTQADKWRQGRTKRSRS